MADFLKSWQRKRTAYGKLPRVMRLSLTGLAFLLLPAGVVAMFTPLAVFEIGSILIFTSLTILSFEFDWAYNLLSLLRRNFQDKRFRRKMTVFVVMMLTVYAVLIFLKFR